LAIHILTWAAAILCQAAPPSAQCGFSPPTLDPGSAIWNARFHGVPVRVCGVRVSQPRGYNQNTYILWNLHGEGLFAEVTQTRVTDETRCVTGVILRRDGYTEKAARRLGLRMGPTADTADDVRMLYECNDQASCTALVEAVAQRSAPILEQ
jgi:hypothetical protein